MTPQTRLIPLADWPKFHPWPTERALRWIFFHREKNGFSSCVVRVGRRILMDEAKFFEWASTQENSRHSEAV
jgi:hypothetical protein